MGKFLADVLPPAGNDFFFLRNPNIVLNASVHTPACLGPAPTHDTPRSSPFLFAPPPRRATRRVWHVPDETHVRLDRHRRAPCDDPASLVFPSGLRPEGWAGSVLGGGEESRDCSRLSSHPATY